MWSGVEEWGGVEWSGVKEFSVIDMVFVMGRKVRIRSWEKWNSRIGE